MAGFHIGGHQFSKPQKRLAMSVSGRQANGLGAFLSFCSVHKFIIYKLMMGMFIGFGMERYIIAAALHSRGQQMAQGSWVEGYLGL